VAEEIMPMKPNLSSNRGEGLKALATQSGENRFKPVGQRAESTSADFPRRRVGRDLQPRSVWFVGFLLGLALGVDPGWTAPPLEEVPPFDLRVKIEAVRGEDEAETAWTVAVSSAQTTAKPGVWSDWVSVARADLAKALGQYPNSYLRGWPVVLHALIQPVSGELPVQVETRTADSTEIASAVLFGPRLGLLVWRDEVGKGHVSTMAEYNRRYWRHLDAANPAGGLRPERILLVDRFIGGDDDRRDWEEGLTQLARLGCNVLMLPPEARLRDILRSTPVKRTAWAVYNPPGYAFAFEGPSTSAAALRKWAEDQAKPYREAGYAPEDMAIFAMSDEPGWYYPSLLAKVNDTPALRRRFHLYLRAQGLTPGDVGARDWSEVRVLGRSAAQDLPSRRLFYWSMRFFPWASATHFADCTRALEEAFYPGLPVTVNWNFFAGRLYVPGPVANNADKDSPDAAMGGQDWFEFGRERGSTMLWTEDWFGDAQAYQWSFYASKLRSAAAFHDLPFGGYVIPRVAGGRENGLLQKTLCLVGHGARAVKYFWFGPEYNFPGNCWSENPRAYAPLARAARMIAQAEDLLAAGRAPQAQVAILMPQSAQVWDLQEQRIARGLEDATNTNLNARTVGYMAEVFDLYLALMHANVPVDFVDEEALTEEGLNRYRVLYVTAPNVPIEGQQGLARWVQRGGTLVTTSAAATRDRYDQPTALFEAVRGLREAPRERLWVPSLDAVPSAGWIDGEFGGFEVFGVKGQLEVKGADVIGRFEDGSPAVTRHKHGAGQVIHFAALPGLSYCRAARWEANEFPSDFPVAARRWITAPVRRAGIQPPVQVDRPLIEAPLLVSNHGAALTLLNWTNAPVESLGVKVRTGREVTEIDSVDRRSLAFTQEAGVISFRLPLDAADIVRIRFR